MLSEFEGTSVVPESDVNREYHMQQQLVALSNGEDTWASRDNPNERLLKMARTVTKDREQPRIKLPQPSLVATTTIGHNIGKRSHRYEKSFLFIMFHLICT